MHAYKVVPVCYTYNKKFTNLPFYHLQLASGADEGTSLAIHHSQCDYSGCMVTFRSKEKFFIVSYFMTAWIVPECG